jgi:hypothetical protein
MQCDSLSGDADSQIPRAKPSSYDGLIISTISDWEKAVMHEVRSMKRTTRHSTCSRCFKGEGPVKEIEAKPP